jgi:proton-translocating NADH-quinone oxidoreductase chain N
MDPIILKSFISEIFLSLTLLFLLVINSLILNVTKYNFPIIDKEILSQLVFSLICVLLLLLNNSIEGFFSYYLFVNNFSIKIVKISIVFISIFLLFPISTGFKSQRLNFFEYFIIFLFSLFSTLLLVSASDFLSIYLSIELQSLSFFILASFRRNSVFSSEAGLKYFILGSFISGILLLGCSLIFGGLGTLNLINLNMLLSFPFLNEFTFYYNFILFGMCCLVVVFLFKIGSAPFHFWMPDVYEGAPLASTIIFSILPKCAIFFLFLKLLAITDQFIEIKYILIFSGILSTLVGSFFALRQKRVKRLVIYSSIAQMGFLISACSINSLDSITSIYFFLFIYILTSFLLWSFISLTFNFNNEILSFNKNNLNASMFLTSLSSFFNINKAWAFSILIVFFSFAGIPPLVGFFAKVFIFFSLINYDYIYSSLILLIISIISVFYYIRIIKIIFFEKLDVNKISSFQIMFNIHNFEIECLFFSFFSFLLIFFFFFPSNLLLLTNLIALYFF